MTNKILKRVLLVESTSLYFAEKIIEYLFNSYFDKGDKDKEWTDAGEDA